MALARQCQWDSGTPAAAAAAKAAAAAATTGHDERLDVGGCRGEFEYE